MARWCKVTKRFQFEAAHRLPAHFGKCARPHGHSYKLEVTLKGKVQEVKETGTAGNTSDGMVVDFYQLGVYVRQVIIDTFDHRDLNEVLPLEYHPTTAENLSWFIMKALWQGLTTDDYHIESIKLWETADGCCEVTYQDYIDAGWALDAEDAEEAISGTTA